MRRFLTVITIGIIALYSLILCVMYVFQEKLIFLPHALPADHSFKFASGFEEIWIDTTKGRLHSLRFRKTNAKGVLLYFHGNAGALDSWGSVHQDFQKYPYDVWILDYRGYGKSEGVIRSEEELHLDAQAFYNQAKAYYDKKEIVIYGRSIGSGIAAKLAMEHPPKVLILETPYFNFPDLVASIYPWVPSFLLRYKLSTNEYIQNQSFPVHLIHGDKDELIPYHSAQRLAALSANITLHTIEGANHNNISAFSDYHHTLGKIFN